MLCTGKSKKWIFALLLVSLSTTYSYAQEGHSHDDHDHDFPLIESALESGKITVEEALLYKFRTVFAPELLENAYQDDRSRKVKCLTPTLIDFYNLKAKLSQATISEIEGFMESTNLSQGQVATYISPSGKFSIEYQTTGIHAVPSEDANINGIPDYVEEAGLAADSSYKREVTELGHSDPIPAGFQYPITIAQIGPYGFTEREFGNPIATSITVENDFNGFPPNTDPDGDRLGALRVTIAHELKHAIQFIDNNWTGETDGWLEMDATLMEELVYDETNDYYNYINNTNFGSPIFQRPNTTIVPGSYEDITFALYFHERFGDRFWTDVWSRIRNDNTLAMMEAIEAEVSQSGGNFFTTLTEAYLYHYASGTLRSPNDYGFEERELYPAPVLSTVFNGIPEIFTDEITMAPYSARFFELDPAVSIAGNASIVVNHNFPNAHVGAIGYFKDGSSQVRFGISSATGTTRINTGWLFNDMNRMGIVVVSTGTSFLVEDLTRIRLIIEPDIPQATELLQNFPNPFNPTTNIQFRLASRQNVRLSVFDITGRLVQTVRNEAFDAGIHTISFDGNGLATGVYIYELRTPTTVQTQKMLLIK